MAGADGVSRPPFNLALVEESTRLGMAAGHRVFQIFTFGQDDTDHVRQLLRVLDPPAGARVLDNGCGIGEVSRLMALERPDLRFVLANISPMQLSLCPSGAQFEPLLGDSHQLALPDGSVDAVMFSSALSQMDEAVALAEARRVLRPGGVLLVNEAVSVHADSARLEGMLACRVLCLEQLLSALEAAGFLVHSVDSPAVVGTHFQTMLQAIGEGALFDTIAPIMVRATTPL